MARNGTCVAAGMALALIAPAALGAWGWLKDSAVAEFTDSDWQVFEETAVRALDDSVDGDQVRWKNEASGTHGSVVIVETFQHAERWCRKIAFRTETGKGTRGEGAYNMCLQDDGTWAFVTESELADG